MAAPVSEPAPAVDVGEYGRRLADAVVEALPAWIRRVVSERATGDVIIDAGEIDRMIDAAVSDVGPRLRALADEDVDRQRTTPLAIIRDAVRYPTDVLRRAGVPAVVRDDVDAARFPDDLYDITPAAFADLGDDVGAAGLAWGAAKAFEHRRRHGR